MADSSSNILVAEASTDEHGDTHVEVHGDEAHGGDSHAGTVAHGDDHHGSDVFPPFDPVTFGPQLFWLAITFGVLYLVMSRVALPRIGEILETRRDRIEGDLAEADRLRQNTDAAIAAYESELSEARSKAHDIAEETREKVKAELESTRASMEVELATRMAAAETRIQETKSEALESVDEIAAETAQAIVTKIAGKVTIKAARDAVAAAKE